LDGLLKKQQALPDEGDSNQWDSFHDDSSTNIGSDCQSPLDSEKTFALPAEDDSNQWDSYYETSSTSIGSDCQSPLDSEKTFALPAEEASNQWDSFWDSFLDSYETSSTSNGGDCHSPLNSKKMFGLPAEDSYYETSCTSTGRDCQSPLDSQQTGVMLHELLKHANQSQNQLLPPRRRLMLTEKDIPSQHGTVQAHHDQFRMSQHALSVSQLEHCQRKVTTLLTQPQVNQIFDADACQRDLRLCAPSMKLRMTENDMPAINKTSVSLHASQCHKSLVPFLDRCYRLY
jgi:hypothetical protein